MAGKLKKKKQGLREAGREHRMIEVKEGVAKKEISNQGEK